MRGRWIRHRGEGRLKTAQPLPVGTRRGLGSASGSAQSGSVRSGSAGEKRGVKSSCSGLSPRAAFARPRVLLSVMSVLLAAGSWWAMAQKTAPVAPKPGPTTIAAQSVRKPLSWDDMPRLMNQLGERRRLQAMSGKLSKIDKTSGEGGFGETRFALTEVDLTAGTLSDEREPAFRSPTGDYIAFASNGIDANRDGHLDATAPAGRHYHIFIMRRDGTGVRQLTGFNTRAGGDALRDQRAPTWSPDGTRICYYDVINGILTQLNLITVDVNSTANPLPLQITFFPGRKLDPAWSPGGDSIAFASNVAPTQNNSGVAAGGFDILTISPSGSTLSVRRLTGDPDNRQSAAGTPSDPQDVVGNTTDDRHPAYSQVNPGVLYFSSNRETILSSDGTTTTGTLTRLAAGRRIFAMNAFNGDGKRQITNPVARGGTAADEDDYPTASRMGTLTRGTSQSTFLERVAFQTNSLIDPKDRTRDRNVWSLPITTRNSLILNNASGSVSAFEGSTQAAGNVAQVESNALSTSTATTLFQGSTEDRANDEEPAYSRIFSSNGVSPEFPTLVFASQRRISPRPGSNAANPRPIIINPGGGDLGAGTHDLWTTASQDFTPPLLVPQGTGNERTPFLAPGRQAPFFAPRTAEEGLGQNSKLIVGVVIQDQEAGLNVGLVVAPTAVPTATAIPTFGPTATPDPNATATPSVTATATPILPTPAPPFGGNSVSVRIRSSQPTFDQTRITKPNEGIQIVPAVERNPPYITPDIPLNVFDDGPISQGGHERQANAIRGDGVYYAQASIDIATVLAGQPQSDFFIDLNVTDRANNAFTYDKVYGFSTQPFTKQANLLFVSDYTTGQQFPYELTGGFRVSRINSFAVGASDLALPPIESYHLANPGGGAIDYPGGTGNGPADLTTFSPPGTTLFGSSPTSVDVYRVLARGPLTADVLRLYSPQSANQINPNAPGFELQAVVNPTATPVVVPTGQPTALPTSTPGATGTAEPLPTVPVTVAETAIIWAAPYTGDVLAAPGTIADTDTQRLLSDYLNRGGRLFLNGQDVIFTLSQAGTTTNTFLRDELKADWNGQQGETGAADVLTPNYGFDIFGNTANQVSGRGGDPPVHIHVPFHFTPDLNDTYFDASDNDNFGDVIKPVGAGQGENVSEVYAYGNNMGRAGQIIQRTGRAGGLESAVVFFSFGLEQVNREWTKAPNLAPCRNYRAKIAENVANFLRTGRITGRVTNAVTGEPVPNFLVQLTSPDFSTRFFLVRTDQNGNYAFVGVPSRDGFYRISPASQFVGTGANTRLRSLNPGYYSNNNILGITTVIGGQTNSDNNFRVNPINPSNVIGRAISDRGTPTNLADDLDPNVEIAPNLPVLLRSLDTLIPPSASFPLGGSFAQLVQTDASGQFAFTNVPSDLRIEIIFNPRPGLVSQGGDIPDGSGIDYNTNTALIQRNPNYGRRVIPADAGYTGPRVPGVPAQGDLIVPEGSTLDVGDVPIPPAGAAVSGRVLRAGRTQAGATVQLLSGAGVAQQVTTNTAGQYTFRDVQPGTYRIVATFTLNSTTLTGSVTINVGSTSRGSNVVAPDITLNVGGVAPGGTPTPTARPTVRPTATPTGTPLPQNETYQPGQQYMISTPYADSTAATAITTVAKAFDVLPTSGGVENFRLFRYNSLTNAYVQLTSTSTVRRGEGYFLRPLARALSLRRPPADPTRFPTSVTDFTITLRRSPSNTGSNNGFNLIGFPFNPAAFTSANWLESRVIAPNGQSYPNLTAAVGAGLINPMLFTLEPGATAQTPTQTLLPFRGYFAQTYVDGVRVVLHARR